MINEINTNNNNEGASCCSTTNNNVVQETKTTGGGCCGGGSNLVEIDGTKGKETLTNSDGSLSTSVVAPEIVCGSCAISIKNALGKLPGVAEVAVDVATKEVTVKHNAEVNRERIAYVLDRAGYTIN